MADGFVADFQKASGLTVDYKEDFNDNEQWFAKVKEPLSRKQDIGADLAVPTTFMMVRLQQLGWLNEISDAGVPNKKNLRPDLLEASVDPGRKYSAPYMSGLVGLAYNRAATGRDITTIDDMWDPGVQGQGQHVLRHPGRPRHAHDVAGQLGGEAHHRDRPEGDRPGQGTEGQGPDPPLHRQRLRRRPGGGQYRCRPSLFG